MSATADRARVVVTFGASGYVTSATGPVLTLTELMKALGDELDFMVLTHPSLGLPNTVSVAPGLASLRRWLCATPHDLVYLNSLFDREYTLPILFLRRLGLVPRRPTIIAPHGELLSGAMSLKSGRKRVFLHIARTLGLCRDVWLHATNQDELRQTRAMIPWARGHLLAEVTRSRLELRPHLPEPKVARLAFIGRISPVKNLDFALRALAAVRSTVRYDIYGPIERVEYWAECQKLIAALPSNVTIRHHGEVDRRELPEVLSRTDLLFLPSKSENFGHAIFEALCCGVPVLVGNRTPWSGLAEAEAGWDLPLDLSQRFASVIDEFSGLDDLARERLRAGARRLSERYSAKGDAIIHARQMFQTVLAGNL